MKPSRVGFGRGNAVGQGIAVRQFGCCYRERHLECCVIKRLIPMLTVLTVCSLCSDPQPGDQARIGDTGCNMGQGCV